MSYRQRICRLGLLTALAVSGVVATASASTGGHFTSSVEHSKVSGSDSLNGPDQLELHLHGLEGGIHCPGASYTGTMAGSTTTELLLIPTFGSCWTTGGEQTTWIHANGCQYRFTVGTKSLGTIDLVCPTGAAVVATHPNCTITIPAQNNVGGITYTTTTQFGFHAITVDIGAQLNVQYHGGICIFTGTSHTATLKGSLLLEGTNWLGEGVSITAT
jgi:hypothetical protein